MIKINELRIGNFCVVEGKNACISGFVDNRIYYRLMDEIIEAGSSKSAQNSCEISVIKPIPITEERLLKCGFLYSGMNNNHKYFRHIDTNIGISFADDCFHCNYSDKIGDIWENNISVRMKHIHQLQNLYLALIGEELKVIYNQEKA